MIKLVGKSTYNSHTVMRTYPSGLSTDQKNRCGALSTCSVDLVFKLCVVGYIVENHSVEKPKREENRKSARARFGETYQVIYGKITK